MSEQYPDSSARVDSVARLLIELKGGIEYNSSGPPQADFDGGFQWASFDLTLSLGATAIHRLERLSSLYQIPKNRLASWLLSELIDDLYQQDHPGGNIPDQDSETEYVYALCQIDRWQRWRDAQREVWRALDASGREQEYADAEAIATAARLRPDQFSEGGEDNAVVS